MLHENFIILVLPEVLHTKLQKVYFQPKCLYFLVILGKPYQSLLLQLRAGRRQIVAWVLDCMVKESLYRDRIA